MGELQVKALEDANLTVYDGEFLVILGPSGSGKSTLLQALKEARRQSSQVTIDAPLQGTVLLRNIDPGDVIAPGTPLFEVGNLNNLKVETYILAEKSVGSKYLEDGYKLDVREARQGR